ncbi:unnamed protein product [Darwinula stevensoni]|uniref:Uncharacterized protein n=1 Tax=Darwinula stevensoni TaxID=69355 RepID=A0A7R9ADT2_9CRUS|nr:unnamed protein product [Darwinula stevensoni]CAG0901625.1 unnamed protein product [Darwinula stevensoni]
MQNCLCDDLKEVASPTSCSPRVEFDIRDHLQVCMGDETTLQFRKAEDEYLRKFYKEAGKIHYSLPSGYNLKYKDLKYLLTESQKDLDNGEGAHVELSKQTPDHAAKALVFHRMKDICGCAPSLVIADFKFCETFNIDETYHRALDKRENESLSKERPFPTLKNGSHCTFLSYPTRDRVYNIFFQVVEKCLERHHPETVRESIDSAVSQCRRDEEVFKTMCGPFLDSVAIVAAFPSLPFMERGDLSEFLNCGACPRKIMTRDDLHTPDTLRDFLKRNGVTELPARSETFSPTDNLFYKIFSLYVCASSSVRMPRTELEHTMKADAHLSETLFILTPDQKELIEDNYENEEKPSWLLPITGGSGTGKTLVLKERAKRLAKKDPKEEVIIINLPGGLLTEDFRRDLRGLDNVRIWDGKEKGILESLEDIVHFLLKQERGKHVLLDEVPLTLGIKDRLDEASLSAHWAKIEKLKGHIKSLTLAFRPNDARNTEEEIERWTKVLDYLKDTDQKLTLTIAFQSHSRGGRGISLEELGSFFERHGVQVVKLPECSPHSKCSSNSLISHICSNETHTPLRLDAKCLPTASRPGAYVHGAFICFRFAMEQDIGVNPIHVLASDEKLLLFLESLNEKNAKKLMVIHPKDFRGCESSVSITVNVEDSWLLESMSRARTMLFIIDCLPDHQQVWRTMREEGRIEEVDTGDYWSSRTKYGSIPCQDPPTPPLNL